jgi:hypothetical protein
MDPSEFPTVPVDLAPAALVRRRGEQRRARTRVGVGAAMAMVAVAIGGTAVALADRGGPPDSIGYAATPTPTTAAPTPTPTPTAVPSGPRITWLAFTPVDRMSELLPGDWVSGTVQVYDYPDEYDRCDATKPLGQQRTDLVSRDLRTTDGRHLITLVVEGFPTAGDARATLGQRTDALRRCPVVPIDAPGAGSTDTATVATATERAITVRSVVRECQQDHADCKDAGSVYTTIASGRLLLTVRTSRADGDHNQADLDRISADFAERATTTYGQVPPESAPLAFAPEVGATYYAAVFGANPTDDASRILAQVREQWGTARAIRLGCLEGAGRQFGNDELDEHAVVAVMLPTASSAEVLVNNWHSQDASVSPTVVKATVRCLETG